MRRAAMNVTLCGVALLGACSSDDSPAAPPTQGVQEAGTDATPDAQAPDAQQESSTEDAASDSADAALKCEPQSVAGWTPTWHPPTGMYQGKCAAGEIKTIMDACYETGATGATCGSAKTEHPDCAACLLSQDDAASWGPVVFFVALNYTDRNDSGCVALLQDDVTATGCGAKVQAYWECVQTSCTPGCKIRDGHFNEDLAAYNTCAAAAQKDENICKPYYTEYTTCITKPGMGFCQWKPNEKWTAVATRIGELFCGTNPEAGTDAGQADAAQD